MRHLLRKSRPVVGCRVLDRRRLMLNGRMWRLGFTAVTAGALLSCSSASDPFSSGGTSSPNLAVPAASLAESDESLGVTTTAPNNPDLLLGLGDVPVSVSAGSDLVVYSEACIDGLHQMSAAWSNPEGDSPFFVQTSFVGQGQDRLARVKIPEDWAGSSVSLQISCEINGETGSMAVGVVVSS